MSDLTWKHNDICLHWGSAHTHRHAMMLLAPSECTPTPDTEVLYSPFRVNHTRLWQPGQAGGRPAVSQKDSVGERKGDDGKREGREAWEMRGERCQPTKIFKRAFSLKIQRTPSSHIKESGNYCWEAEKDKLEGTFFPPKQGQKSCLTS